MGIQPIFSNCGWFSQNLLFAASEPGFGTSNQKLETSLEHLTAKWKIQLISELTSKMTRPYDQEQDYPKKN